jgi:hypothetical protein
MIDSLFKTFMKIEVTKAKTSIKRDTVHRIDKPKSLTLN